MKKKNLIKSMAVVCALTLLVGSFAFFTDRETQNSTATAGDIDLVFTDTSLASESFAVKDDEGTLSDVAPQARDSVWENGALLVENGVLNPGDTIDMDYKLANTGSKSIDVKQQIVLTSNVALTDDAEEYTITVGDQNITPDKSDNDLTLTYELDQVTLQGTVEKDGDAAEIEYEVAMAFARAAKNKFMESTVEITLDVQAKQHRNTTSEDWVEWASYTTDVEVFPAA